MLITEWRVSTGFPLFGVVLGRTQNVQKLALVMRHSYGKHEILQKNDHPTKPIIFGANLPCFVRPVDFGKLLLAENCPPLLCSACKSVHWETLLSNREQCKPEWYRRYKLEAFCTNLRRGARRPPGGFGRIRGVEFFLRENRPRRRSQPLWVKPAGQKYVDNHIFVIRTCVMTTIVCRFCRSDWFRFLFAPTR